MSRRSPSDGMVILIRFGMKAFSESIAWSSSGEVWMGGGKGTVLLSVKVIHYKVSGKLYTEGGFLMPTLIPFRAEGTLSAPER